MAVVTFVVELELTFFVRMIGQLMAAPWTQVDCAIQQRIANELVSTSSLPRVINRCSPRLITTTIRAFSIEISIPA